MLNMNFITWRPCKHFLYLNYNVFKNNTKLNCLIGFYNSKLFHTTAIIYQKEPSVNKSNDSKQSNTDENNTRKKRNFLIGAGSLILGGSLFAIYLTTYKKKHKETNVLPIKEIEIKIPSDAKDIPHKIPYLLIGGGTASFSAFRAIKSSDATAKVLLVSNELYNPYMRPPLSKEMWFQDEDGTNNLKFKQWNGTERSLFFEPDEFFIPCQDLESNAKGGVSVVKGWTVFKIDPENKKAVLDDGTEIEYDKCLIATGIKPKNLPVFEKDGIKDKVTVFRTIDDFKTLYKIIEKNSKEIAIIGGSFLGSELACSLSNDKFKLKITQIFPEKGNLAKILPEYLSSWATKKISELGVNIISNADIDAAELSSNRKQVHLQLSNGQKITVDHVIVAAGSVANTELAESSGLETDPELGGFLVNTELAARTDLYAAGDCACFYDSQLGRRRIEHHDHAVVSGRLAGENMTGAKKPYKHQSMFWSDVGPDIAFEAIGIVDSSLPTVAVFAKPSNEKSNNTENKETKENSLSSNINTSLPKEGEDYSKGVIFYLKNDVIVGIVLWNIFNRIMVARQVLQEQKKFDDLNEVAKLFEIHAKPIEE